MSERKIPTAVKAIIVIELFIALLGLITGASLVTDPSGSGIGLDVLKDKIPFQSLFLLGLWFLGPYGVLPASLAYGFIKGKSWAWKPALYLAIVEVAWVLIQIPMVGRSYLQLFIGSIAVSTIYLLYRPSVSSFLNINKSGENKNGEKNR